MARRNKRKKAWMLGEPVRMGIADAMRREGEVIGNSKESGLSAYQTSSACSCGGENPHCFKCDGTGYYVKTVLLQPPMEDGSNSLQGNGLSGFSSDSRGGDYSIRQRGQFSSNPLHDDYGDESGS
jgi:hypothetical protein